MKYLYMLGVVMLAVSCTQSPRNIVSAPSYIVDLTALDIRATHSGEELAVTLVNTSSQALAVDKPWFGPCSSVVVTPVGSEYPLNPRGSAALGPPIIVKPGAEVTFTIPVVGLRADKAYRVVYTPYPMPRFYKNKIECLSEAQP